MNDEMTVTYSGRSLENDNISVTLIIPECPFYTSCKGSDYAETEELYDWDW